MLFIAPTLLLQAVLAAPAPAVCPRGAQGFTGLDRVFAFGDSYTATGFDVNGAQPTPDQPLGPSDQYLHVWTRFLATAYEKVLLTYNLAFLGATVDEDIIKPFQDWVKSFEDQVVEFNNAYTGNKKQWNADTTLFVTWFGQNDIDIAAQQHLKTGSQSDAEALLRSSYDAYQDQLDKLYSYGARNFLLITPSAIERTPKYAQEAQYVKDWVVMMRTTALEYVRNTATDKLYARPDVNVGIYDPSIDEIAFIDSPDRLRAANVTDTTNFCSQWSSGCALPPENYLWYDSFHFQSAMNKVWADALHKVLG